MKWREMAYARKMLRCGREWPEVLRFFNGAYTRDHIEAEFAREKARNRNHHGTRNLKASFWMGIVPVVIPVEIPEDVEADWNCRMSLVPQSLTARICGDPLPGYSALDKCGGK